MGAVDMVLLLLGFYAVDMLRPTALAVVMNI